jgi:hypothetical protein
MRIVFLETTATSEGAGTGCVEKGSGADPESLATAGSEIEPSSGKLHVGNGRGCQSPRSRSRPVLAKPSYGCPGHWRNRTGLLYRRHLGCQGLESWSRRPSARLEATCGLGIAGDDTGHSYGQHLTGWMPESSPFSSFVTCYRPRPTREGCRGGSNRPQHHLQGPHPSQPGHPLAGRLLGFQGPGSLGLMNADFARSHRPDAFPAFAEAEAGQCNPWPQQGSRLQPLDSAQAVRGDSLHPHAESSRGEPSLGGCKSQ